MKRLVWIVLIMVITSFATAEEPALSAETVAPQVTNVAYYFYNTSRCPSCLKIEKYSHETITAGFADRIAAGELAWMMKNLDEEENEHFIEDYKLFTKALVLVRYQDGQQVKWKNCDKVWELLNDEAAFKKYVELEVTTFLSE